MPARTCSRLQHQDATLIWLHQLCPRMRTTLGYHEDMSRDMAVYASFQTAPLQGTLHTENSHKIQPCALMLKITP